MPILAIAPEKKERELIKQGNHPAYLYSIVYLGTQISEYQGKETQRQRIWIEFEFPTITVEYEDKESGEKKSFVKTKGMELTLSLSEKGNLLPFIEGFIGRNLTAEELQGYDVCELIGKPALVNITHRQSKDGSKTYDTIASVNPPIEGMQMPEQVNPSREIGKSEWEEEMENLPEFIQAKIKESNEYKLMSKANTLNSDIPIINIEDIEI